MPAVEVVAYDPAWPGRFVAERTLLVGAAAGAFATVEHVGSTSVPGLAAKPTVDILAVTPHLGLVLPRRPALAAVGYEHRPGAFDDDVHLFFRKLKAGTRTHHLHVVTASSGLADDFRLFREYLVAYPEVAAAYAAYKLDLAARFADDRMAYVHQKKAHVDGLMEQARRWRRPRR